MGNNLWALALWLCRWFCFGSVAQAHISLDPAGTHISRYGDRDGAIKAAQYGKVEATRGANISTYQVGSTIELDVSEFEFNSHLGDFRIAFDDYDDDFKQHRSAMLRWQGVVLVARRALCGHA